MRCWSVPAGRARRRGLGDQVADLLLGPVVQRAERTVGGAVGRDLVVGQPAAVDMAEQIVLRAGSGVDVAQVDTGPSGFYRHPASVPEGQCAGYPHAHARRRARRRSHDDARRSVFSGYGIGSAVLGVVAVAAVVLAAMIWTHHRSDVDELPYQTRVMQAAADWTSVLINMNNDTVEESLHKLHEGTVGQLNADFESTVEPFRQLVRTLKAGPPVRSTRWRSSRSITPPGPSGAPPPQPQPELSAFASRTDTVMVVATSVSENAGGDKPQTVRWKLRLDVSDVDGKLLISRLETDPMRNRLRVTGFRHISAGRRRSRHWSTSASRWPGRCGGCRFARCCAC